LNCINRFYHPEKGRIAFEGRDISEMKPHKIARLGIARTFQNVELFAHMTVLDNIKLGAHVHLKSGFFSGGIYYGKSRNEEILLRKDIEERIIDLLEIEHIRKQVVHALPYGLQKRVELARALAMKPKLLLMDEAMAGMNPKDIDYMVGFLMEIKEKENISMLAMVEHIMRAVAGLAARVMVMHQGAKLVDAPTSEALNDSRVIEVYLGG